MTREEYISKLEKEQAFLYFHLKPMDEKQHNKWINHIFYLIKQSASNIFDDHEAQIKAKDEITQDIKEAYELKSIAYDLLLEAIKLKDEEIERLKEHITHLQNVYMKLDGKYLKLKTELEELKDDK